MVLTDQIVVRHLDGTYTVRTYEAIDEKWRLVREAPANTRSIVQASLDGKIVDVEEEHALPMSRR